MSKNITVLDKKPRNVGVVDVKSDNEIVSDLKSKNITVGKETEQYYSVILTKGNWMGMGLFTYPTTGTISSSFSP